MTPFFQSHEVGQQRKIFGICESFRHGFFAFLCCFSVMSCFFAFIFWHMEKSQVGKLTSNLGQNELCPLRRIHTVLNPEIGIVRALTQDGLERN